MVETDKIRDGSHSSSGDSERTLGNVSSVTLHKLHKSRRLWNLHP